MLCDFGVFLKPYTLVLPETEVSTEYTLEELNSNTLKEVDYLMLL